MGLKGIKDSSRRRFPGMGGRRHNPVNITTRRAEAKERQEHWNSLSPAQQLEALDRRLGKGLGAAKQRVRLQSLQEKSRRAPTLPAEAPASISLKAKERRAGGKKGSDQ